MESAEQFIARKSRQWESERERVRRWKDIGRDGTHDWLREAWTFQIQENLREKVIVIERLRSMGRTGAQAYAGGAREGMSSTDSATGSWGGSAVPPADGCGASSPR